MHVILILINPCLRITTIKIKAFHILRLHIITVLLFNALNTIQYIH